MIGVPDPTWGQNVTAVVVLREGQHASAEEIIEHCRDRIASYKKPKQVEFTDALPRHGFAIDYDALDASYGGGGYPGPATDPPREPNTGRREGARRVPIPFVVPDPSGHRRHGLSHRPPRRWGSAQRLLQLHQFVDQEDDDHHCVHRHDHGGLVIGIL